jgi:hypothetical protein
LFDGEDQARGRPAEGNFTLVLGNGRRIESSWRFGELEDKKGDVRAGAAAAMSKVMKSGNMRFFRRPLWRIRGPAVRRLSELTRLEGEISDI